MLMPNTRLASKPQVPPPSHLPSSLPLILRLTHGRGTYDFGLNYGYDSRWNLGVGSVPRMSPPHGDTQRVAYGGKMAHTAQMPYRDLKSKPKQYPPPAMTLNAGKTDRLTTAF